MADPLDFCVNTVLPALVEARRLRRVADDDATPFASKYAAADLLAPLAKQAAEAAGTTWPSSNSINSSSSDGEDDNDGGAEPPASSPASSNRRRPHAQTAQLLLAHAAARCQLERGLALVETDLLADGQAALEASLAFEWPETPAGLAARLAARNALGALWCDRGEFAASLQHLAEAEAAHARLETALAAAAAAHAGSGAAAAAAADGAGNPAAAAAAAASPTAAGEAQGWDAPLFDAGDAARDRTATLFYLAQVHGHAGDRELSAAYCAATLNRQLQQQQQQQQQQQGSCGGALDVDEWVQNALQLSGFFVAGNAFAVADYVCAAVEVAVLRWAREQEQGPEQQQQPDAAAKDQAAKPQQQQQQQQAEAASPKAPAAAVGGGAGDKALPLGPTPRLTAALARVLEPSVAANVQLARGKLLLQRLAASHARHVERRPVECRYRSAADVPAVVRFDGLPGLPPLAGDDDADASADAQQQQQQPQPPAPWRRLWGDAALARDFAGALALFKAGAAWLAAGLAYYRLDGWVTEHVTTLFELSNLHRLLAGFELDAHRRCVLQRRRGRLLGPLEGELSPAHFPGLARSVSLELGNVAREVAETKRAAGREPAKVAAAAAQAARHYARFLAGFSSSSSSSSSCLAGAGGDDGDGDKAGAWPPAPPLGRVEPEMERHYLDALLACAHALQLSCAAGGGGRGGGGGGEDDKGSFVLPPAPALRLRHASELLRRLGRYVREHGVEGWAQQAAMADEMAGLLREKLSLTERAAAAAVAAAAAARC